MALSKLYRMLEIKDSETKHCEKHGSYKSSLMIIPTRKEPEWTKCIFCIQDENKKAANSDSINELKKAHEQTKAIKMEQLIGYAAIPPRFADRTLENYKTELEGETRAKRAVTQYLNDWEENKNNGTSLIFCGRPGTGKTHLAVSVIKNIIERGDTALFTYVRAYIRAITKTWSDKTLTEQQVIDSFVAPDLLVIDELGHQYGSDAERLILFDLINERYMASKPIIFITNLMLPQLKEHLDERAQDRLRENGGKAIIFDWQSQRK